MLAEVPFNLVDQIFPSTWIMHVGTNPVTRLLGSGLLYLRFFSAWFLSSSGSPTLTRGAEEPCAKKSEILCSGFAVIFSPLYLSPSSTTLEKLTAFLQIFVSAYLHAPLLSLGWAICPAHQFWADVSGNLLNFFAWGLSFFRAYMRDHKFVSIAKLTCRETFRYFEECFRWWFLGGWKRIKLKLIIAKKHKLEVFSLYNWVNSRIKHVYSYLFEKPRLKT